MNIILLSGGSGKRLWPLSNDVRSKQFIKLFKNNDEYESMVQRVYRQITTVDANAKITIATSKSQASAIKNQLGEKASICVEPCRRDTFPAIALAAAYLHDELGVAEDEAVVVCPVDPYVDNTYYEAVKNLQKLTGQGGANLTLMGIEPTYASEKYGYIIPENGENVSKVKEFKEKPDVETAEKYLAQSALWNAGIFAFKLGYLLDNDEYAREHEGDNGKTEMWYVIDADEGASLIYGFQHEVTEEILQKAVETGTLDKHLQKVRVHKGDTYFVPAGTVHGIGKGILVAEIQESSNVTYRVYDYDRVDKNGKKRELHFDKAVQVMNMKVAQDVNQKPRMVKYYSGCSRELLCRCKYFETERIQVTKGFAFSVMDTSFQVLMCLSGYGEVQTMDAEQKPMRFSKGETMFLPAGLGRCLVVGDAELLKIRC